MRRGVRGEYTEQRQNRVVRGDIGMPGWQSRNRFKGTLKHLARGRRSTWQSQRTVRQRMGRVVGGDEGPWLSRAPHGTGRVVICRHWR